MNVAILGGGIIGLSSAYYLNRAGHSVTIFDQGDLQNNCSSGNAGMIVPSHIIPLAAPGMIAKGIRWMFNASSPFYVKPRFNGKLIRWGYQFYRHSTHEHVTRSIPALKELGLFSKAMFQNLAKENLFPFGFEERGLLMLYQTKETEKEEIETAHIANQNGIEAHVLSPAEIQKLEPHVRVTARGAVYFPGDAHVTPHLLVKNLMEYIGNQDVKIYRNTPVTDARLEAGRVKSITVNGEEKIFDEYILAAGAWSGALGDKFQVSLPMQGGKGYSFTLDTVQNNIQIPSLLLEGRVAVTPMGNALRFGGTMEINGTDLSVNMKRVKGIVDTIPAYYPEMKVGLPAQENVWRGLRPCSPDGLPYIGRSSRWSNLIVATGHSMMGLSLAPGTGKLVTELVQREKSSVNLAPFNPERFR